MERDTFADLLRRLRESRALTQEELAERAGVTVKAVGALERGERLRPYPHTVRALADGLDLAEDQRSRLVASVPSRGGGSSVRAESHAQPAPGFPAPILGRTEEIELVTRLLREEGRRLVTLTGPGGVGKTRLALETASRLGPDFPGGTVVVELAAVREPAMVLPHVAAALGVPEAASDGTVARLAPYLLGRRVLLVLDNLEQLVGCAPVVADLVAHCPDLAVLATSRAALKIRAEREVVVAPLAVPDDEADAATVAASAAVGMFLDRAQAAGADIAWTDTNAAAVAAICRRLDGLPLALELAAANTRLLTPTALLARLDERTPDGGPRDLPDRQRTMAATLDWSRELLEPEEQELFARLAVFSGGFALTSLEAVAGDDVTPILGALVEQSLVLRADAPDEQPRFRLLEPVRQYAATRSQSSGLATDTADRHATHFHEVAMAARAQLRGPEVVGTIDRLEADHANLRSAYLRLLETDRTDDAAELVGSLWLYLGLRGHAREGLSWMDRLEGSSLGDAARCLASTGRAGLLFVTGDIAPMREYAESALGLARILGNDAIRSEAAILAGHAAVFTGDAESAERLLEEGLAAATSAADPWAHAHALVGQGQLALTLGDLDAAEARLSTAVDEARALGNAFTLATSLTRLATVTGLRGDDYATAALLGESTDLSVAARMSWTLGYSLPALAGVAVRLGHAESAARLFGASASLSAAHAVDPRFPVSAALTESDLTTVREQLGEEPFRRAWDAGRTAGSTEIAELAREVRQLAPG